MVRHDAVFIQAIGVQNRPFRYGDGHETRATFAAELGDVIPHVAQPLHDNALAVQSRREAERVHVLSLCARLAECVDQTAPGGFLATTDTILADGLPRDSCQGVHVSCVEGQEGIRDPRHLALAGTGI